MANVEKTRTRTCALGLHISTAKYPLKEFRSLVDREVFAVSKAARGASKFLELQLRTLLDASAGRLPEDFPVKIAVTQAFAAMQAKARPQKPAQGYEGAKKVFERQKYGGISVLAPNSLTYESNAYFSTLLCNYSNGALGAHVYWTLRHLFPELRTTLKTVIISRQGDGHKMTDLPTDAQELILQCQTIQDKKYSAEVACEAIELRWKCLQMLQGSGTRPVKRKNGQVDQVVAKRFCLVPQCRKAARFITLDEQWARCALGLTVKPKPTDFRPPEGETYMGMLMKHHPTVRKWCKNPRFIFPKTIKTDGIQLQVPFIQMVPRGETEAMKDKKSRDSARLKTTLESHNPHGFFHLEAAGDLDHLHPSFENCVGVDPGVKNMVTTDMGTKITRADFYGFRRKRTVFYRGSGSDNNNGTIQHSRRTRRNEIPALIVQAEKTLSLHGLGSGGTDMETFTTNLLACLTCAQTLQEYYGSHTQRSIRLTRSARSRQSMAGVVNTIAPDSKTVVLFGANFNGRSCRKGDVAGPVAVKGIRRALARTRVVVSIDEYNTTKCHAVCGKEMGVDPQDAHEKVCLHCVMKVDRDVNSGVNIRSVWRQYLIDRTRPVHLRRPTK